MPSRSHYSHRHLSHAMGNPQPPTLPPKPGELKEETSLCKLHSQTVVDVAASKRRQEEVKPSRSDDRKHPVSAGGHHHHHHRHTRHQDEPPEAPHRSRRRPVQSPALVGEDPQSLGISSPILGEERTRVNATRASPVMTAVTSASTGKKIPASKDYMEKIGSHKASIEALRRELRSVETASSAVTTVTSGPAVISNISQSSRRGGDEGAVLNGRVNTFSRGLLLEGGGGAQLPYPPPSISPSDEAAARLADASGSASFGDLRSAILASTGNTMVDGPNQRKELPTTPKENDGLLAAPQDATYLESESDSGPEQVGINTVRRSIHEPSTSKHTKAPLPEMSSPGEAPRPPSLPRSSSLSSTNSSVSSSVVSYSRSQSLFSHGAAVSDKSSLSQLSSSSDLSSDTDHSFSSMSTSPERYSHHRHPHHHYHACPECVSRSQGHLQSYLSGGGGSHRSLSRHIQRHSAYFQEHKTEGKRSKSSHSSRSGGRHPDSSLLKSLINDEIALETISRQQKLLKKELEKQKKLAAELEEAKRLTQKLLEEKVRMEKQIEEPKKRSYEEEEEADAKSSLKENQRVDEEKNKKKKEESPVPSTSHHREGHHRSSSSGKRHHHHHHHRKGHRHRKSSSGSDEERGSDEKSKKSPCARVSSEKGSEKREEDSKGRGSHQKHSHSKGRHRHHHKASNYGEKDDQENASLKEKTMAKAKREKEETTSPDMHKLQAQQASGEIKQVGGKAQSELDCKVGIFQQLNDELPPPPPQSPPPSQYEAKSPEAQKKSTPKDVLSSPQKRDGGSSFPPTSDEAGLAKDIIKEA
ncbi:unnamed protein product [Rodentolepis nana]|uniref:Uncharacterized protein n=1 Tax=Rodentolepis nana TaxID=102285 RepID=A0A3P7VD92_RODNA|nr:unnamed protein product [Rodentolepis nana]